MIYDMTGKNFGEKPVYSDGCVIIFRTDSGNVTVKFDPGIPREEATRAVSTIAERLRATETAAEKMTENSDPPSAANFYAPASENSAQISASTDGENSHPAPEGTERKPVNPDDVAEDVVRWRDGYTAYKMNGKWWWIRWHDAENELWGMSGPLMNAIDVKKGPFDNFDETLASMMRHRAEIFQKNSYIG